MSFANKKGIALAGGFKLQSEAPLDARMQVDSISDRDELVTIHAAWEGMKVYVKADKTSYEYKGGTTWAPVLTGTMYKHPSTHPATMITEDTTHRFMTDTERNKLKGIAEGANKYTHPGSHSLDMITETDTKKIMTSSERTKLQGIEAGANKYTHPSTHSADMIVDTTTKVMMTLAERNKLSGISGGANAYTHPDSHPATMITQDETHRFMTDAERTKLQGIEAGANKYTHPTSHSLDMIIETTTKKIMTDVERTKLQGIEAGANKYTHPTSHPASMITQDETHRFMTDAERTKLQGIANNANNYIHPGSHSASMITQDSTHRFVTDTEKNTWNGKANANHTHDNYLPKSGGTVTGPLINTRETYVHSGNGTSGQEGFVNIATIKITGNYQNAPLIVELSQRSKRSVLYIQFASADNTDPGVGAFKYVGDVEAYLVKATTSTWHLYIRKTESYDNVGIVRYHKPPYDGSISITWTNVHVASVTGTYTKAERETNGCLPSSGTAVAAQKLTTNAGGSTQPVYFANGKPVACGFTIAKSVPGDAKFTDTVYIHPTTSGNKHIPTGGSAGKILRWSADGTAVWGDDKDTTYGVVSSSANGLMTPTLLTKLNGIAANANNYTHPTSHPATMITEDTTHRFMTDTERTKLNGIAANANNYTHPTSHPASMITEDTSHRFVTDTEINTWNGKPGKSTKSTVTLSASGWVAATTGYKYTLSVSGVTTSNNVEVVLPGSATDAQVEAWMAAGVACGTQTTNSITLRAFGEKPEINIPLEIIIRKDI